MMKKLLYLVAFTGLWATVQASPLKLSVRSDANEALWYAYVYVNGRAVTVTDTLGFAQVPEGKLNVGDTLSVSYVGTEPQWVVYDKALQKQGEYAFVLPEKYDALVADEVVVKVDLMKFFKKNTRESVAAEGAFTNLMTSDLQITIKSLDGRQKTFNGSLKGSKNMIFSEGPGWPAYYHRHLRIKYAAGDTTGFGDLIYRNLQKAIGGCGTSVVNIALDTKRHDMQLKYFGKQDGCRVFRVVFPEQSDIYYQRGRYRQALLRIDEKTLMPRNIEMTIVDLRNGEKSTIVSDYAMWGKSKSLMYATNPRMHIEYPDGTVADVALIDPVYTQKIGKGIW